MGHTHSHNHSHSHNHKDLKGRNLFITIFLNILITLAQLIGGIISGSLSLLSDALHNFSDVLSLIISYIATKLSKRKASVNAFVNSSTLIVVSIILVKEAIERFANPVEIESNLVIWLSLLGIIGNGFSVLLIKKDAKVNMNMKSAYLHLFTDMMASVAVLIGGLLMKFYALYWVDPVLTILIAFYLVYMGYDLLKTSTRVLMLFTPNTIEIEQIVSTITKIKNIKNVHHVHVWQLNENEVHLEAHIDFDEDINLSEFDQVLEIIEEEVYHKFGISHLNIQPEYGKCDSKKVIVQD